MPPEARGAGATAAHRLRRTAVPHGASPAGSPPCAGLPKPLGSGVPPHVFLCRRPPQVPKAPISPRPALTLETVSQPRPHGKTPETQDISCRGRSPRRRLPPPHPFSIPRYEQRPLTALFSIPWYEQTTARRPFPARPRLHLPPAAASSIPWYGQGALPSPAWPLTSRPGRIRDPPRVWGSPPLSMALTRLRSPVTDDSRDALSLIGY